MKSIPNVFVGVLAAGFGLMLFLWQEAEKENEQQKEQIKAYSKVIEDELKLGAENNEWRAREISAEIENQVLNMGKRYNLGLKDTINLIQQTRKNLFRTDPSPHLILAYFEMIRDIHDSMVKPEYFFPKDEFQQLTPQAGYDDKLLWMHNVLEMERIALNLFDARVGKLSICSFPRITLQSIPKKSREVVVGEVFETEIAAVIKLTDLSNVKVSADIAPLSYQLSVEGSYHSLCIPTQDLLPPDQSSIHIPYQVEYHIPKATGGYETLTQDFEFTVIAPCETP